MWRKFWHQVGLGSLPNPCQAMWWSSHWCILKGRIRRDLSTWAHGWKALPWKRSRRVCRRTMIVNLGLQNVSSVSTFPKKGAILFYFLQPASIQLLVFASGASVPTGSAENIPLCCPLHEKVPRVSYTFILKSLLLCPLSNEHKKRWRKFRCHENCLTLQVLDLRRPSYFPLRR